MGWLSWTVCRSEFLIRLSCLIARDCPDMHLEKLSKTSIRVFGNQAEIRNCYLPNISLEIFRYSSLLALLRARNESLLNVSYNNDGDENK